MSKKSTGFVPEGGEQREKQEPAAGEAIRNLVRVHSHFCAQKRRLIRLPADAFGPQLAPSPDRQLGSLEQQSGLEQKTGFLTNTISSVAAR